MIADGLFLRLCQGLTCFHDHSPSHSGKEEAAIQAFEEALAEAPNHPEDAGLYATFARQLAAVPFHTCVSPGRVQDLAKRYEALGQS